MCSYETCPTRTLTSQSFSFLPSSPPSHSPFLIPTEVCSYFSADHDDIIDAYEARNYFTKIGEQTDSDEIDKQLAALAALAAQASNKSASNGSEKETLINAAAVAAAADADVLAKLPLNAFRVAVKAYSGPVQLHVPDE
jgi:hypothetical protein